MSTTGTPLFENGISRAPESEAALPGETLEAQPVSSVIATRRGIFTTTAHADRPGRTDGRLCRIINFTKPGRASDAASFLAAVGDRTFLTLQDGFAVAVDLALQQGFSLWKEKIKLGKGIDHKGKVARLRISCNLSGALTPGVLQRQGLSKKSCI